MSALSYNANVSFNLRIVLDDEAQVDVLKAIHADTSKMSTKQAQAHAGLVMAFESNGMDAAVTYMVRLMFKDVRKSIINDAESAQFKNFSPFTVEVTPRGN